MDKVVHKRVVSVTLRRGELHVGLVTDSRDARDGKYETSEIEFVHMGKDCPTQVGAKVKITHDFGVL